MVLLPTCVLTAVLASAVSCTTVLPCLAYNGLSIVASPSFGQVVMDMHVPTAITPPVMLATWQGSERRLQKRAPIPEIGAEEHVPLLNKPRSKKYFFDIHGTHNPEGTISEEHAAKPMPTLKELRGMRKEAVGDESKQHGLAFEEKRTIETRLHSPLRKFKIWGSHALTTLKGLAVGVFNKKKGDDILERTKKEYNTRMKAEKELHENKIKDIHKTFNAPKSTHFDAPLPPRKSWFGKGKH